MYLKNRSDIESRSLLKFCLNWNWNWKYISYLLECITTRNSTWYAHTWQYIITTSHKELRQAVQPGILMRFSQGSILKSLLKPCTFYTGVVTFNKCWSLSCDSFFIKLSGIDPYEKRINKVGMLDDRLVAMIYILASVHCSVASTFRVWKSRIHTYSKTIQCVNVCIWWKTDVVW